MQRKLLLGALMLSACAGSASEPPTAGETVATSAQTASAGRTLTYYRDVKPIVDQKCAQCHTQGGGGHFSLTSFADVKPRARLIEAAVESEAMPPWRASGPLDQYQGDRRLTAQQKRTILDWIAQGAQEGSAADAPRKPPAPRRGLARVDQKLGIGTYTPKDGDDYRCFVLDWENDQTQYITGLSIEPGDKELVHHGIVYLVSPDRAASVRQSDERDPDLGYRCMGGPGAWLTSYEPGGFGEENPGGVGFRVRPGSLLVLQMHYNTNYKRGTDTSHVELTLEDEVAKVGEVDLISGGRLFIPAGERDAEHRYEGRPSTFAADGTYDFYWADLHMHTRGTSAKMGIIRADSGREVNLLDIPAWAFEWQETYLFQKPVRLHPGDELYLECHFDNTPENQPVLNGARLPVRDVTWGERTIDEMCLGNVLSVRVPDDQVDD
ncbi:MAG: monooxygenase [Polyangiales bacterium]